MDMDVPGAANTGTGGTEPKIRTKAIKRGINFLYKFLMKSSLKYSGHGLKEKIPAFHALYLNSNEIPALSIYFFLISCSLEPNSYSSI
jgi:hypothetical protein